MSGPERIWAKTHGASTDVISGQVGLIGGWNEHRRDGQEEYLRADPIEADLRRIADMDTNAFGAQARIIEAKAIATAALARIGGE